MKFECDICGKQEASVFCLADEAALCNACDRRVHQANKIASRHERFSLLDPSPSHMPLCDICQERRALQFCQQDKAILCRDCDSIIHHTDEHIQKHNRSLLAGIKLSTTATISSTSTKATKTTANANFVTESIVSPKISTHSLTKLAPACNNTVNNMKNIAMDYYGGSTSTISEYSTKILPGWKVEDLFDSIAPPPKLSEFFFQQRNLGTKSSKILFPRGSEASISDEVFTVS